MAIYYFQGCHYRKEKVLLLLKKIFKWFFIGLACLLLFIVVLGSVYQSVSESQDLARFPAPGELIEVDGHLMHIHCQGQGSPTVVVEQGLGSLSTAWDEIHQQIALVTRVCAYDRVGMGYSEPIDHPVRATEVAELLHKLLNAAGVDDDVVLVGWSAGGVYIREYYRQYPKKIAAMLFVDSSHEQQANRMPEPPEGGGDSMLKIARYLAPVGLVRLSRVVNGQFESFTGPEELKSRLIALYHQSHTLVAMLNESEAFSQDIRATQPPDSLGDLPLIVLTQGKPVEVLETMSPGITLEYLTEVRIVWNELQPELAALSTRGNQIIATESGHNIHADQPELLVDSVKELVQLVRQEQ